MKIVWMSWNFVRFHEILNQTDAENFSCLSWQIKKKIHNPFGQNSFFLRQQMEPWWCNLWVKILIQSISLFSSLNNIEVKNLSICHVVGPSFFYPRQSSRHSSGRCGRRVGGEKGRKEDGHLKTLCRLLFEFDVCNACGM